MENCTRSFQTLRYIIFLPPPKKINKPQNFYQPTFLFSIWGCSAFTESTNIEFRLPTSRETVTLFLGDWKGWAGRTTLIRQ